MATARECAARALLTVTGQGGYSNLVLDNILDKEDLSAQDRSFCAALLYRTAASLITLDHALASCCSRPPEKLSPAVLAVLRCAVCQLLYMPSVPQSAAVNEAVSCIKALGEPGAAGFVNGVLRGFVRSGCSYPTPKDALTALSVQYGVPMPLIQLWRKAYGHQTALAILEGVQQTPPLFARVNTCKTTAAALLEQLAASGCTAAPVADYPDAVVLQSVPAGGVTKLPAFAQGLLHVQDISSQRCAAAGFAGGFAPTRVLDVCAAPGGKSFTMAQLLPPQGELVACDLYPARVGLVAEGAARLGLAQVAARVADATVFDDKLGFFDLILCDVVCSGFGILRRKPEIRYKALETLDGLPDLQYNILNVSARYCRGGGRIVYSTCTLSPAENEQVVERFLAAHPGWLLLAQQTTLPGDLGGDGFFYAVLEKPA